MLLDNALLNKVFPSEVFNEVYVVTCAGAALRTLMLTTLQERTEPALGDTAILGACAGGSEDFNTHGVHSALHA